MKIPKLILALTLLMATAIANANTCQFYFDRIQILLQSNGITQSSSDQDILRVGQAKDLFKQAMSLCEVGSDANATPLFEQSIQLLLQNQ